MSLVLITIKANGNHINILYTPYLQDVELNQPQKISVSQEGSRVPLYSENGGANDLNHISDHELDMIMENLDSRIKERIKADKKQEMECVKTKLLAALETYFSNSQTRKLPF